MIQLQETEAEKQLFQIFRQTYQQIAMYLESEFFGLKLSEEVMQSQKLYKPFATFYRLIEAIFKHPQISELYDDFGSHMFRGGKNIGTPIGVWGWWCIQVCETEMYSAGLLGITPKQIMSKETYRHNISCLSAYSEDPRFGMITVQQGKLGRALIDKSGKLPIPSIARESRTYNCPYLFITDVALTIALKDPSFAEGVYRDYQKSELSKANFIQKNKNVQSIYAENGQIKFNGRGGSKNVAKYYN
ncbi:MAG: hypothetical protein DCF20_14880 [Pseudanabaena sp.]|nr:MAG: hypothetical protein DCF20_14880 [Pseudanabaena sp.]